ncbi:MAG: tetratricopeptide repeat protein [Candidatus Obscuribacterales bacterium]|nr:tetratricopeptide repeat protein [Candidatus Obscuribacterales bacterium]
MLRVSSGISAGTINAQPHKREPLHMPEPLLQIALKWKKTLAEAKELIEAKEYKRALVLLDDTLKLAEILNEDDGPEEERIVDLRIAVTLERIAFAYHCLGRLDEAEPLYRRAIEIAKPRLFGTDTEKLSTANLANLLCETGRNDEAESMREAILKKYSPTAQTSMSFPLITSENKVMSSLQSLANSEPNLVVPIMKEVLGLIETVYGAESKEAVNALDLIGKASQMGAEYHERALRIRLKRVENEEDEVGVAYAMRSLIATHTDRKLCDALLAKARAVEKKIGAENVFDQTIGLLHSLLGTNVPVEMPLEIADEIFSEWLQQSPIEPPFVDVTLTDDQRYERLVSILDQALAAVYKIEKESEYPLSTLCMLSTASSVHKEFGNIEKAKALLEEEMRVIANHWGDGHVMMVDTYEEYNAL